MSATLTPDDALALRAGALEAVLWPSLGGRVAALRSDGVDWLNPIPEDLPAEHALLSGGCYPMAPYCGRIENGRFSFAGRQHRLPPHRISGPHSLHGLAWDTPFQAQRICDSEARMWLDHAGGDAWPWAFRLEQTVRLTPATLTLGMSLLNTASERQPVGLGFHPFFPFDEVARLDFACQGWWRLGPTKTPTRLESLPTAFDFSAGRAVSEGFDDVFAGFGGTARLDWADRAIVMTASANLNTAVLYSPPGRGFFCFEPISHAPNAHNRDGAPDLAVLEPGESLAIEMRLGMERKLGRSSRGGP
jgi:aldose 1-epimerase